MVALPRLVVAAPASGHGKTTVATGLMAALARAGHVVSGHKVGPDYIDPGYHALATGRPGRNLDPHLVGEERLVPLLLHGAAGADVAIIEGVMGLFDGQIGGEGFASTAHVASVTRTPVVLVVDISHASRTIGAVVHGLCTWTSPAVDVVGVVLNKAGSARHAREVVDALGDRLPVLGVLQRDDGIEAPSRHLGLVPAAERTDAARALERLAAQVADAIDLEHVVRLAGAAPDLHERPWDPRAEVVPVAGRPRIAVAGGRAFTFRYAEAIELLEAAGAEVVEIDPLADHALPEGVSGLYLGGGFPEMHAAELGENQRLRRDIGTAIARGLPTVAECAGLLYLCRSVRGPERTPPVPMVGAIDVDAVMAPRLTLSYRTATAPADNLLAGAGQQVTGHEFHRTTLTGDPPGSAAWLMPDPAGVATRTLHASYLHTHWAGHPALAQRFAEGAARHAGPDLGHHGDQETGQGLVDLAVNVYDGPRPAWLDKALAAAIEDVASYPDPAEAEAAVARRHGRDPAEVLATAGVAEAFTLIARLRSWRHPVVVHPQFTEPEAALRIARHSPSQVLLDPDQDFRLDPLLVPDDADLVVVGNPTNPTGVRHPAADLVALARPGRLVVVDEAFLDDDTGSLAGSPHDALVVLRSLTKLWSIPGIRAGYLLAHTDVVRDLRRLQTPWSVSTPAAAALVACTSPEAVAEARLRVQRIGRWRSHLVRGLHGMGVATVPSTAPFVLARTGAGSREALRAKGFAVRRADTFPGLDATWVRIAVRREAVTDAFLDAVSTAVVPALPSADKHR